jgi:hypothetical protein
LNKALPAARHGLAGMAPLRVLVVEDEALVSLFLTEVLTDLGHEVAGCAVSLQGTLRLAASTPADIALVDIGLAGEGDGIDVAVARPLGYLMKPYTELDVERALADAAARMRGRCTDDGGAKDCT